MNSFNFDHTANGFFEGLGVGQTTIDRCKEVIYFSTISNYLIKSSFYEKDEPPLNLTTVTGDLEKSLALITTQQEKDVLLLMFKEFQQFVTSSIRKYKLFNELPEKDRKKAQALFNILDLMKEDANIGDDEMSSMKEIFSKIKLVEKSNYNFDKYLEIVANEQN